MLGVVDSTVHGALKIPLQFEVLSLTIFGVDKKLKITVATYSTVKSHENNFRFYTLCVKINEVLDVLNLVVYKQA